MRPSSSLSGRRALFASLGLSVVALTACSSAVEGDVGATSAADTGSHTGGFLSFGGRSNLGKCLDVMNDSMRPGVTLDSTACNGTPAQSFVYTGNRQISPAQCASLCLDANNAAGVVQLATCNGSPGQTWSMANGTIRPSAAPSSCLDVYAGNTRDTARIDLAPCNGTPAQLWWPWGFTTTLQSNESYGNGLIKQECLDVQYDNSKPGANLDDTLCNGTDAQLFTFTRSHEITNHGLCLDVLGANASAGVLHMQPCNGTAAQGWELQQGSGGAVVVNQLKGAHGSAESLDVYGNRNVPGTTVDLAPSNGTNAQLWHPVVTAAPQIIQ